MTTLKDLKAELTKHVAKCTELAAHEAGYAEGYAKGQEDMRERAAKEMDNIRVVYTPSSLPRMIRDLPITINPTEGE